MGARNATFRRVKMVTITMATTFQSELRIRVSFDDRGLASSSRGLDGFDETDGRQASTYHDEMARNQIHPRNSEKSKKQLQGK